MAQSGRHIVLEDLEGIEAALGRDGGVPSEYCFANLFLFRQRHHYRVHQGPVPHLRGTTYDGEVHALPLCPVAADEADALLKSDVDCLFPLTDEVAEELVKTGRFTRSSVAADDDYLFDGPALAGLDGSKTRRSQARRFSANAAPSWEDWDHTLASDALSVLEGWLADVGRDLGRTDVLECREAIACCAALGLEGGLVREAKGTPVGFLLASTRDDGERVVHFAKGRREFEGVYPWMFAHYANLSGALRLNFEQDLGNPGLAQSKQAYRPVARRTKWRLYGAETSVHTQFDLSISSNSIK